MLIHEVCVGCIAFSNSSIIWCKLLNYVRSLYSYDANMNDTSYLCSHLCWEHSQCNILNSHHSSSRVRFQFSPTNKAQQIAHLHKVSVSSRKHHICEGHCCQCYCCKNIGCNMGIADHCFHNTLRVAASQFGTWSTSTSHGHNNPVLL